MTVQVIEFSAIFSFGTERSKCFSSHNMFAYFAPYFFFSREATFALTRIYFKLLALLKVAVGIFFKDFPCSLSSVNSKCISNSTFLSFEITG